MKKPLMIAFLAVVICAACGIVQNTCAKSYVFNSQGVLRFDYTADKITKIGQQAKADLETQIAEIIKITAKERTFANTAASFENALAAYTETLSPLEFLAYVSPDEKVRETANKLESDSGKYLVEMFTRDEIYKAMKEYADKKEELSAIDAKLFREMMRDFKRNGMALSAKDKKKYKKLKNKLIDYQLQFGKNIRDYKGWVEVTRDELDGMSDMYINKLEKTKEGKYKITIERPVAYPFLENGRNEKIRRKIEFMYHNRCSKENAKLLKKTVALRDKIAKLLGYKNHAEYVLEIRMAKKPRNVFAFISGLRKNLKDKAALERDTMLAVKEKEKGRTSTILREWQWRYWNNQNKINNFKVDHEKIREYFPAHNVVFGMLDTFSEMFNVEFVKTDIPTWHTDVLAYEVKDNAKNDETIAYFYLDMYPREGKYKHAACWGLVRHRQLPDGEYRKPFAAVAANFDRPTKDIPSLLTHDEVTTLFHEFGHVLHNLLSKAKYGTMAGTLVARDFVEVPSTILENWAWTPEILKKISGHYKNPSEKLPDELIERLIAARTADTGVFYERQVFFSLLDMTYHTNRKVDTTDIYKQLQYDVRSIPMTAGTRPEASFGHLMGGYDAGYYSYQWSDVIAADMFGEFKKYGFTNPAIAKKFRDIILAVGSSYEEKEQVIKFLGRKPSNKAFLELNGLQ